MKAKLLCVAAVGVTLLASVITSQAGTKRLDLLGDAARATDAQRTIVITPSTKYVRVESGEIVKFVVGDKTFAWNFNGSASVDALELNRIAPPGVLEHKVTAYIDLNPRYLLN